jgi:hypothetical protein
MRRIDRWMLCGLLITVSCGSAAIDTISWSSVTPGSGAAVGDAVRVGSPSGGGTFPLLSIAPAIPRGRAYAIEGRIRYEGVDGAGYLEMWSDFPRQGRFFSRTLAPAGPLGVIHGDSDWRDFQLPFDPNGGPSPARLDLNLVLPGSGTVEIGPIEIRVLGAAGWWSDRTAGAMGGGAGALIGLIGATVGVLASRRKARGPVLATMIALCGVGVVALAVGGAALVAHQPYAVVFPLLLLGAILVAVFGAGYGAVRRGYEEAELRKMHALDAAGV